MKPSFLFCAGSPGLFVLACAALAEPVPVVLVGRPVERETTTFDFPARLEPADAVEVRAPLSGSIAKVHVRPGATVKQGERLFEYAPASLEEPVRRAEETVKQAEEELKRRQAALDEAEKLSATDRKEVAKDYDEALGKIKDPLERARDQAATLLKAGLPEAVREDIRQLFAALEGTTRLARARTGPAFDSFLEGKLDELRPVALRVLNPPPALRDAAWRKEETGKQFLDGLRAATDAIDRIRILSRARSAEGVKTLDLERDLADVRLNDARRELDLVRAELKEPRVTAPVGGTVLRVNVKPEERVRGGGRISTVLCTVAATDRVRVAFAVEGKTLDYLRKLIREGTLKIDTLSDLPVRFGLSDGKDFPFPGRLEDGDARPDPRSGRVTLQAVFTDAEGTLTAALIAGEKQKQQGTVRLVLGPPRKVLLVPQRAVGRTPDGKDFVLVVDARNHVELRTVKSGLPLSDYQDIEEGLKPGDRVIVGQGGGGPVRRQTGEGQLSPLDFGQDRKFLNLRPGSTVEPREILLPGPAVFPRRERSSTSP